MNTPFADKFAALVLAVAINALMIVSVAYLFDSHLPQLTSALLSV